MLEHFLQFPIHKSATVEQFTLIHVIEDMLIHGNYSTVHHERGLFQRPNCDQERQIDVVGYIFMLLDKYI